MTNWRGFDRKGIHKDTGTKYDLNGFDKYGLHKDTGKPYNLLGKSRDGELINKLYIQQDQNETERLKKVEESYWKMKREKYAKSKRFLHELVVDNKTKKKGSYLSQNSTLYSKSNKEKLKKKLQENNKTVVSPFTTQGCSLGNECWRCHGTGKIETRNGRQTHGFGRTTFIGCPVCGGTGKK